MSRFTSAGWAQSARIAITIAGLAALPAPAQAQHAAHKGGAAPAAAVPNVPRAAPAPVMPAPIAPPVARIAPPAAMPVSPVFRTAPLTPPSALHRPPGIVMHRPPPAGVGARVPPAAHPTPPAYVRHRGRSAVALSKVARAGGVAATRPVPIHVLPAQGAQTRARTRSRIVAAQTQTRCHFHTLSSPRLAFHREVLCNHSHGRHPDVHYTGGV